MTIQWQTPARLLCQHVLLQNRGAHGKAVLPVLQSDVFAMPLLQVCAMALLQVCAMALLQVCAMPLLQVCAMQEVQHKLEVAVPAMFQMDDVSNLGFLFGLITLEPIESKSPAIHALHAVM